MRMTTAQVAKALGSEDKPLSTATVRAYVHNGYLKATSASGELRPRETWWFDRGEVEAFRDGGAKAAKAYREAKGSANPKKGRRVAV